MIFPTHTHVLRLKGGGVPFRYTAIVYDIVMSVISHAYIISVPFHSWLHGIEENISLFVVEIQVSQIPEKKIEKTLYIFGIIF